MPRPKTNKPIRDKKVVAPMTKKEFEETKEKAKKKGLLVSEYIRYLIKIDISK